MKGRETILWYIETNYRVTTTKATFVVHDRCKGDISPNTLLDHVLKVMVGGAKYNNKDKSSHHHEVKKLCEGWFKVKKGDIIEPFHTHLCTCFRMSLGTRNWESIDVTTNEIVRTSDIIKSMQSVDETIGEGVLMSIHAQWLETSIEEESEVEMAKLGTFD